MKIKKLVICMCIAGVFTLTGCASIQDNIQSLGNKMNGIELKSFTSDLDGTWQGELSDGTDLSIIIESDNEKVYLTSKKEGCSYYELRNAKIKDGKLHFLIPRKSADIIFDLSLTNDNKLKGSSKFYDNVEDISLIKDINHEVINRSVNDTKTSEFNHFYIELQDLIKENSQYKDDNMDYKFSYDLKNKNGLDEVIKKYKIDEAAGNKKDVELMESLLNWECDLLNHSSSNIAENMDLNSLIEEGIKNGTNCRGLSLILSQVLRMYGIKAQAVACKPYENIFNDCHVVVNAYSDELKQWIMLDPTYRFILKDGHGKYINVQSLRENIANNVRMTWNSNAGYNEGKMDDAEFQGYLEYMAKNSCRYVKTEENFNGSDGEKNKVEVVLVSNNYEEPRDAREDYNIIVTTDSERFWNN